MARIRVVTDSACDLSADLAASKDVTVVPLSIRFGSEEFVDGSTLSTAEFWARCKASSVLPETSAPSPGAFQEAFLAAADNGYELAFTEDWGNAGDSESLLDIHRYSALTRFAQALADVTSGAP